MMMNCSSVRHAFIMYVVSETTRETRPFARGASRKDPSVGIESYAAGDFSFPTCFVSSSVSLSHRRRRRRRPFGVIGHRWSAPNTPGQFSKLT